MSRPDNKCDTDKDFLKKHDIIENYVEHTISLILKAVDNIKGVDKRYNRYNYTDLTDKEKIVLKHCVFLADRESGMYTMHLPKAARKQLEGNMLSYVNQEQRAKAFDLLQSWKNAIENSSPILGEDLSERKEYRKKILTEMNARMDELNAKMAALNEESVRRVSFEGDRASFKRDRVRGEGDDTKVATEKEKINQTIETVLTISAIASWAVMCYGVYLNYRNSDDDMIGGGIEDIKNKYDAINRFIKEENIDIYNEGECPNLSAKQKAELDGLFKKIGTEQNGGKRKRNKTKRVKRSKQSRKTRAKRSKKSRKTVRRR